MVARNVNGSGDHLIRGRIANRLGIHPHPAAAVVGGVVVEGLALSLTTYK